MSLKNLVLFLIFGVCSGCSVIAYTPVVVTSGLGWNQTDLNNDPKYAGYIDRPFYLMPLEDTTWQLKKFTGGRYHIGILDELSKKEVICDLMGGSVVVVQIFDDSINGGIFYRARVSCDDQVFDAPLNRWSDNLEQSIQFIDE